MRVDTFPRTRAHEYSFGWPRGYLDFEAADVPSPSTDPIVALSSLSSRPVCLLKDTLCLTL